MKKKYRKSNFIFLRFFFSKSFFLNFEIVNSRRCRDGWGTWQSRQWHTSHHSRQWNQWCFSRLSSFLVADTKLYKRLCPPIRWSVHPLVRPSVGPWWLSRKVWKRAFMMLQSWLSVFVIEHWVGDGMDRGCMRLPTRPQQYCDPASPVFYFNYLLLE